MHVEVGAATRWGGHLCAGLTLASLLLAAPAAWAAEEPDAPEHADSTASAAEAAPAALPAASRTPDPMSAWWGGGELVERANRARLAALQVGIRSFDAPARALLLGRAPEGVLQRAEAAVAVAPDLPLAQAALAGARLREAHDLPGAVAAGFRSLRAIVRHPEARLWLEASGALAVRDTLFLGALVFLFGLAALHARAAAHDLGDRFGRSLPLFARAGMLGVLVLVPAMLGQGLLGVGLSLFALAQCYGSAAERRAGWVAAALLLIGLELGTFGAARAVTALDPDPVAAAFQLVERGMPSRSESLRFEYAADSDPLAARGLALQARRDGRLAEAARRYEALVAADASDPTLLNNAANVLVEIGDVERAIPLYQQAAETEPSGVALFNLSGSYGRTLRLGAQEETLKRLQQLHPALAVDVTHLQSKIAGNFTLDLPLAPITIRSRPEQDQTVAEVAARLRRSLAPGVLGDQPVLALLALVVAAAAGRLLAALFERSNACDRCGARLCPRCEGAASARGKCVACHRLFERPETADPERSARRLAELERRLERLARVRLAASVALPGAAGLLSRRPWLGLLGALAFCSMVACAGSLGVRIVDPLAAGGAGALAFGIARAFGLGLHACVVAIVLHRPAEDQT